MFRNQFRLSKSKALNTWKKIRRSICLTSILTFYLSLLITGADNYFYINIYFFPYLFQFNTCLIVCCLINALLTYIGFSAAAQRAMSKREIVNYPYQLLASRMDRVTCIVIRLHVETEDIRRCYQYSDLKLLIGNSKQVGRPCLQIRRSDGAFLC